MISSPVDLAARRLAAIVESSDDAIVSKDLNGIIMSWNRAAERMFGYTAEEAIGQSILLIIPDDRRGEEDHVLGRIRAGRSVDHFETVRRRKDGTFVQISLTVSPIRDGDGVVVGASKIARDITERKAAEAALASLSLENARAYARASEANRLKDEFLATLSHELRTPLSAILGYTRLLRLGKLTVEREAPALEVVERNALSLKQIIEDVLDVSRIAAGKVRLNVGPVSLAEVVVDALTTVRPAADAKGVTIDAPIDHQGEPVPGDRDRLRQVLWNLLSNAVKFTSRGGHVHVSLERQDWQVEIVVADDGQGVDPEFLPHMFERFRQADSSFARQQGGLGLGLAIVRELVEMHGGTVCAESPGLGQGTTIRVRLPVVRPVTTGADGGSRASSSAPVPAMGNLAAPDDWSKRLEGVRVVVVDDEEDAIGLLEQMLKAAGADVRTARSAAGALAELEREVPDVLVSDIGMPGMDGLELIRQLRQSSSDTLQSMPALALTAYARLEDRVAALASGYHMHMVKPADPAELVLGVAALARRRDRTGVVS